MVLEKAECNSSCHMPFSRLKMPLSYGNEKTRKKPKLPVFFPLIVIVLYCQMSTYSWQPSTIGFSRQGMINNFWLLNVTDFYTG